MFLTGTEKLRAKWKLYSKRDPAISILRQNARADNINSKYKISKIPGEYLYKRVLKRRKTTKSPTDRIFGKV